MQSLRHSPISPVHDLVDRDITHSATTPRHRLDSTALPHIAMSPPIEAFWHSSDQITSSVVEAERHLQSPEVQTVRTRTDKATQEPAGDVHPQGHTERHLAAGPVPKQNAGLMDAVISQGTDRKALPVTQNIKQPPEATGNGEVDHTKPDPQSMVQEVGESAAQQVSMGTSLACQGTSQPSVASLEAAARQQAAVRAVQQAEERLRELVLGADYSEKDWYYVDPQVIHRRCQLLPRGAGTPVHMHRTSKEGEKCCRIKQLRHDCARAHIQSCAQGATQGPCCIAEFRGWMHDLQMDPQLSQALKQFSEVAAWKVSDASAVLVQMLRHKNVLLPG